jgi:hypothetical protein
MTLTHKLLKRILKMRIFGIPKETVLVSLGVPVPQFQNLSNRTYRNIRATPEEKEVSSFIL